MYVWTVGLTYFRLYRCIMILCVHVADNNTVDKETLWVFVRCVLVVLAALLESQGGGRHGDHREPIRSPAAANQRAHQELGHRRGFRVKRLLGRGKLWSYDVRKSATFSTHFTGVHENLSECQSTDRQVNKQTENKNTNKSFKQLSQNTHLHHSHIWWNRKPDDGVFSKSEVWLNISSLCLCVYSWTRCASRLTTGTPGWTSQKQLCWSRAQPASTARRYLKEQSR